MELPKIFKADVAGGTRVWWSEVGEDKWEGYWRTHSGTLNGVITTSVWKEVELKSQSTIREQALFYANAEMKKKLRTDYKTKIEDIDETRFSYIRPMLAGKYVGWQRPCFVQPKLDGVRCLANKDGLWTRTNSKIISTPHIEGVLKNFFSIWPSVILDGELYNHDLHDNFNKLISLARKTIPSFADLEESAELVEYWIYDCFDLDYPKFKFEERWQFLEYNVFDLWLEKIVKVPTKLITTEEELDIYNIELLTDGYEGQIVRLNSAYEQKRSDKLLKRKEFVDEEYELLDILEGAGQWSGFAKIAVCQLPNGKEFRAGISGDQAFCLKLLGEKDKYNSVTIKYQALTPDGIPRFPIAIKFYEEMFDGMDERIKPRKDLFA
jgi:DNA ligase-1